MSLKKWLLIINSHNRTDISIMTTLAGTGMVMYMTMFLCLTLAKYICYFAAVAEQVPRLTSANTSTTCCLEHVRKYCCCTNNIYEITFIYNIHESPQSISI